MLHASRLTAVLVVTAILLAGGGRDATNGDWA